MGAAGRIGGVLAAAAAALALAVVVVFAGRASEAVPAPAAEPANAQEAKAEPLDAPAPEAPPVEGAATAAAEPQEASVPSPAPAPVRTTPAETPYIRSISGVAQGTRKQMITDALLIAQKHLDTSRGESVKGVTFDGGTLIVNVDIVGDDGATTPELEQIAMRRAGLVASDILSLSRYGRLWDSVVVDFGQVGFVTLGKDDLVNDAEGWYFCVTDSSFTSGSFQDPSAYQAARSSLSAWPLSK